MRAGCLSARAGIQRRVPDWTCVSCYVPEEKRCCTKVTARHCDCRSQPRTPFGHCLRCISRVASQTLLTAEHHFPLRFWSIYIVGCRDTKSSPSDAPVRISVHRQRLYQRRVLPHCCCNWSNARNREDIRQVNPPMLRQRSSTARLQRSPLLAEEVSLRPALALPVERVSK
jgi:hypothetical protein